MTQLQQRLNKLRNKIDNNKLKDNDDFTENAARLKDNSDGKYSIRQKTGN